MWYIRPNYSGTLPKFGDFEVACILILEDIYSHIVPITAKEGKFLFGETEDDFCYAERYVMYDLRKRRNSMLT